MLISLGVIWGIFLLITYIGSHYFLRSSFLQLERERVDRDLSRIDQALEQVTYSLYTYTADWSHWNDLYAFIQGKNPDFVENNLTLAAFINSSVNLLTYWDKAGNLIVGKAVDSHYQRLIPLPAGLNKYVYPGSLLLDRKNVDKDLYGNILLPSGIMLVAAAAITDGTKTQPILGATVAGRDLTAHIVRQIADTTRLTITLFLAPQIEKDVTLSKIYYYLVHNTQGHFTYPVDENTVQGFALIRDIYQQPIGMFQMSASRQIYLTGMKEIRYYLISFTVLGILFVGLLLWLLRKVIVGRLERLDEEVAVIGSKQELSRRVDAAGNDELASVSHKINKMMDIIQAAQQKLEHRVRERTKELEAANIQLQEEITERKAVEQELTIHKEHLVRLAHYDNLTSLPNRILFNETLDKALIDGKRNHKKLAILFIDLDRFKRINDALGHPIGDLVLKEIAQRFASVLREGDILARLGGDEFIILLNNVENPKAVSSIAEKLLSVCSPPVKIQAHEFVVTASIGICFFPSDGTALEELTKNADMAMYKAKRSGGGVYQYYTKEMDRIAHEHIKIEEALRKAISENEFVLSYQPKLNLADGMIVGVEALIRWESPKLGIVSPGKFIPLAEESGLIIPIGEWALREACRANKSWQNLGYKPISMAVNLSAKQFRHQNIALLVEQVLKETGLDPQYLELEITETAVMDDLESTVNRLKDIKGMGVQISIDDFGTGYTSIHYLKQFPISGLKIDQSFIKGIPDNQDDVAITSAVIALAHNLGIKVVAEGVETAEQLRYLADHNCDIVQGYFLSRPLSETNILLQLVRED